jgi:hypothetical protein
MYGKITSALLGASSISLSIADSGEGAPGVVSSADSESSNTKPIPFTPEPLKLFPELVDRHLGGSCPPFERRNAVILSTTRSLRMIRPE